MKTKERSRQRPLVIITWVDSSSRSGIWNHFETLEQAATLECVRVHVQLPQAPIVMYIPLIGHADSLALHALFLLHVVRPHEHTILPVERTSGHGNWSLGILSNPAQFQKDYARRKESTGLFGALPEKIEVSNASQGPRVHNASAKPR